MIKYLENETLEEMLTEDVTIVDFYADWCGPCRMLGMILEELEDVKVIKINVDKNPDLARKFKVMSIPHLCFYKNKELKYEQIGFMSKDDILKKIEDL